MGEHLEIREAGHQPGYLGQVVADHLRGLPAREVLARLVEASVPSPVIRSVTFAGASGAGSTPVQTVKSRCSVKAIAGRPVLSARAQLASMSPGSQSQDHSVCTCPSVGSMTTIRPVRRSAAP